MSDAERVRQVLAGRTEAYEELARRWVRPVLALCHTRVGCTDAADDLAQDTLLRGLRDLTALPDPTRFGPWLCGIARQACQDWLKNHRSMISSPGLFDRKESLDRFLRSDEAGDSAGSDEEELRYLIEEVEALPEDYREALILRYYEDTSYRDLADLLGVSPATFDARLSQARAVLRERLGAASPEPGPV